MGDWVDLLHTPPANRRGGGTCVCVFRKGGGPKRRSKRLGTHWHIGSGGDTLTVSSANDIKHAFAFRSLRSPMCLSYQRLNISVRVHHEHNTSARVSKRVYSEEKEEPIA